MPTSHRKLVWMDDTLFFRSSPSTLFSSEISAFCTFFFLKLWQLTDLLLAQRTWYIEMFKSATMITFFYKVINVNYNLDLDQILKKDRRGAQLFINTNICKCQQGDYYLPDASEQGQWVLEHLNKGKRGQRISDLSSTLHCQTIPI